MLPAAWQDASVTAHGDLYLRGDDFVRLHIDSGRLRLNSVNRATFGVGFLPDVEHFETQDMT
jgi:hypothetical protein